MEKIVKVIKKKTKVLNLNNYNNQKTLVVTIDMLNGFIREGALESNRAENIIGEVFRINKSLSKAKKLFFVDEHHDNSKEFNAFPKHCIKGTSESSIIDELLEFKDNSLIIKKNCTNGFVTREFRDFYENRKNDFDNIIIMGVCTDICVKTFAITLQTYINEFNLNTNLLVDIDAVETYDLLEHDGDLMNVFALYDMQLNGIGLCKFNN